MYFFPPASPCSYLPDRMSRLEYRLVDRLTQDEYLALVQQGWRRFGQMLFRPRCPACMSCQPIRVLTESFRLDRSQRRVKKLNEDTTMVIGAPVIDDERVDLYYRHHQHHSDQKGWREPDEDRGFDHMQSIIGGPLAVLEFSYYRDNKLVAVSYIDDVGEGFSGIYFYHDPDYRKYSLGNWICISLIEEAARCGKPYVYLGYYIAGCRSMEYKGRFGPNQVLGSDGTWHDFET